MSGLLSVVPYLGALLVFIAASSDIFRPGIAAGVPDRWQWRLVGPVLISSLSPLGAAGKAGLDQNVRVVLISATAFCMLFVVLFMALAKDGHYYLLSDPVSIFGRNGVSFRGKAHRVRRKDVLVAIATGLIAGCCAANFWASLQ